MSPTAALSHCLVAESCFLAPQFVLIVTIRAIRAIPNFASPQAEMQTYRIDRHSSDPHASSISRNRRSGAGSRETYETFALLSRTWHIMLTQPVFRLHASRFVPTRAARAKKQFCFYRQSAGATARASQSGFRPHALFSGEAVAVCY
ncbi:uncharacterized protein B0H64DRAFT_411955 [Chaetomium fimeti]|uniref:Uncharacterized protein n=1 Tax=Chaetomium fimeti TaxID=1854472 RepID=A0AAE0LMW2_9PEZI|nr:hypothetical protein B0H64DRAFT_411955 [Chaetomium fimeti]